MPVNRVNDACLGGITGISNSVRRHLQQHDLAHLLGFELHEGDADDDPDDLTDTADDADEDAKSGGEAEGGDGEHETTLLNTQLHGQEADEVGKQRGERHDEDGVQIGERETREASATVDAEEQEHEEYLTRLDDTRQVFEQQ